MKHHGGKGTDFTNIVQLVTKEEEEEELTITNLGVGTGPTVRLTTIYCLKCLVSNKKNYETCKETKYDSYTGGGEVGNRNCP